MEPKIAVLGLRDLSRRLRKIDGEAAKQLRIVFNEAAEIVVSDARPKVPKRTGRAAGSLKMRSTRTAVRIAMGGPRAPYYPWLDFGGRVGPNTATAGRSFGC
ncbi:HK97 gp10 family phage protein [Micromonospora sp. WMMA1363]|uniref:HK97 gp10 family phage protein n=1 Tax=Micromonospora sp. WMMA1363 TaxID=3053985 RepID=UPI00259D0CBC|nr:HK97 gp10 family phage protein [Micromonospora sp. WMMA1363]MDM4721158.1 HK97 gp10 family phage protein [Micromonospora sp. WMMA1363]